MPHVQRKQFSRAKRSAELPDLVELQKSSYKWFLGEGLKELFAEISPVEDFTTKKYELEFGNFFFEEPVISESEARENNLTFKTPLRVKIKLKSKENGEIKEQEVFLGDFPMMTERGTFIINGVERVVVSQIVRSYGVIFVAENNKDLRRLFGAKIIPNRGAWLEIETNSKDVVTVKIDRKRKIPVSAFLKAFGYTEKQIINLLSDVNTDPEHDFIKATLEKDNTKTADEAVVEVYKKMRPGDLTNPENARAFLETTFFTLKRYDLSPVGRYKINKRLGISAANNIKNRVLRIEDFALIVKEVIRLNCDPKSLPDDIDSLSCRRIRAVGELVQNKVRVGLLRMERIIKDRMSVIDPVTITPALLINARPVIAVLQEFFASSQLSQFMNQTNPLSELEHKRTISATGPGGLSRERAGFEVRDVHPTHYGRLCPIESPEGPNIGLVSYISCYAKVNKYGFIETPYRIVDHSGRMSKITEKIIYLDADTEQRHHIMPTSGETNEKHELDGEEYLVRFAGKPIWVPAKKVEYVDVSAKQIVSITTALIPFLENTDAARAMMGSNMQRQAVSLVRAQAPIIGTGVEMEAAKDSGQVVIAYDKAKVMEVDNQKILVKEGRSRLREYNLEGFARSNQATCMHQRPIVSLGDEIKKGQIIADSLATENGEIALGQNILVGFMSFAGANFEDAIIISEKLVKDDRYTSIHIEKYSIEVRETKLGPEMITRDIPNVGEEALRNLDETGIVRIGAEVKARDILLGKITPKGETELSAEERLLLAIFGEKAKDVKDTSLRLPHGEQGKIVDVKIFDKAKDQELPAGVNQLIEVSVAQLRKIQVGDKLAGRHGNKGVISKILPVEDMPVLPDGTPLDIILNPLGVISRMNIGQILETHLAWAAEKLNYHVAAPVFEGPTIEEIQAELKKANFPLDGKIQLRDGRTGEPFDQRTTVGVLYVMKLLHLVDDKMHARSIGPYSMVAQQPLGGKAQFGGQRFGEMEVWALEAYGASNILQEMLTIKSDDMVGRSQAYEAIIKGEEIPTPSTPESFNVLVKELQSLGLNIELLKDGKVINK